MTNLFTEMTFRSYLGKPNAGVVVAVIKARQHTAKHQLNTSIYSTRYIPEDMFENYIKSHQIVNR